MNNHLQADTFVTQGDSKCSIILDRLSLCYSDPDVEHVKATAGLLVSDHITKFTPGMQVTANRRYAASCRLRLPFDGAAQETVCFEAGPRHVGQASYRLEFNPAKLSPAGLDDLFVFLTSSIDPDPREFIRGARVTRCDAAIDLPGHHLENVIVRSSRLQKHGLYSNRQGLVETTYLGTPKSRRVVAYEKPIKGTPTSHLRVECRLKPRCLGHQLATMQNPFAGVQLIPVDFSDLEALGIPYELIADSMRIGGHKRVLMALHPSQRKPFKKALEAAHSLLPNLDAEWAAWPNTLVSYGLGKELGAVPLASPGSTLAPHSTKSNVETTLAA